MIELRDYQEKAVNDIFDYICTTKGNPVVIAPTGSGKSIIIAEFIRRALNFWNDTKVLMLTHQKELIEQDMAKLKELAPELDVGVYSASLNSKDASHSVTFASIQSIAKRTDLKFDVAIVDECHLINNDEEGNYRSFLGTINCRVIGFTATPYRLGQGEIVGENTIFDKYIETTSILKMQNDGYLSRLSSKLTKTNFDIRTVSKYMGDYKQKELNEKVNTLTNNKAVVDEILYYINKGSLEHIIIFCTSVEHAYSICDLLNEKDIYTVCVEGSLSKQERESRLEQFTSGKATCITNVNVLSIGFDYPNIDCVVMLRPTLSTGLYVQQAGRGLRIAKGKKFCLLLDFAGNVMRHGPVGDLAAIPEKVTKRRNKDGVPLMKTCPQCLEMVQIGARVCPECEYEFPKHEKEFYLFTGDVNGDDETGHIVDSWSWILRESKKGNLMWIITYTTDKGEVKEYLVIDEKANPFARSKAYGRMRQLSLLADIDYTRFTNEDDKIDWENWGRTIAGEEKPFAIVTKKENQYTRIIKTYSEQDMMEELLAENKDINLRQKTLKNISM